jgi:hypothetical protein
VPDAAAPGPFFVAMLVVIGVALLAAALLRSRVIVGTLVAAVTAFAFYCGAVFLPELSEHKSMKTLCETWHQFRDEEEQIGFYGTFKNGVSFYCDPSAETLDPEEFLSFMEPGKRAYSIVERTRLVAVLERYRERYPDGVVRIVDDSHFGYVLLTNGELEVPAARVATRQTPG